MKLAGASLNRAHALNTWPQKDETRQGKAAAVTWSGMNQYEPTCSETLKTERYSTPSDTVTRPSLQHASWPTLANLTALVKA